MNPNSMLYWWQLVKGLDIPMPKTVMVPVDPGKILEVLDGNFTEYEAHLEEMKAAIQDVGLPLFLRTDHTSGKHRWKYTCYYESGGGLQPHVHDLVKYSQMVDLIGLSIQALVFREYIEMASLFTAFTGEMPVSPERRYFVEDGHVKCYHPYWIADAIEEGTDPRLLPDNWLELCQEMNTETDEEVSLLMGYAEEVASILEGGAWSIDFCKAKDGRWIFIDMALAQDSWHPIHY